MKSSLQKLFERIELLYENTYKMLVAFQQASETKSDTVEVEIRNADGTYSPVKINSFQRMLSDIARIDENYRSLTSGDNLSYLLNGDGSITQVAKTSFMNAEFISNMNVGRECVIDRTSIIENLVFPNVKIPVTIDTTIRSAVRAFVYEITSGWDEIPDNPEMVVLEHLIETGRVICENYEHTLNLEKEQVRLFGKFTTTNVVQNDANNWTVTLTDLMYKSLNSVGASIQLKTGDVLVQSSGATKYQITDVNTFTKIVSLKRIGGIETPFVGIDSLLFNEVLPSDNNIVGIPVKPGQKLVVFLSTENLKNVSYPSNGFKLDTSTYTVVFDSATYTLDEFFSEYVSNIGEYINSLINETSIPASLGIIPEAPKLDTVNFKVLQVNKHLASSQATDSITKLTEEKEKIKNDIQSREASIKMLQSEIDTLKFATIEEKQQRIDQIANYQNEIATLNNNLLTVTRNLDSNASSYGLKDYKPKYRIIGYWDMAKPIISSKTTAQHIIKYDVQYRYLSKTNDIVDSTTLKMYADDGSEVNVVFSAWVDLQTRSLNKVENASGKLVWETPIIDSVEDLNINQCMIPIRDGESVEIRVRAVSEAGYPISPLKSAWSEIIRIDFPESLTTSSVNAMVSKNDSDLLSAEFQQILISAGLIKHVQDQLKESEKLFYHRANNIASGFYTEEQKNIDLFTFLNTLKTRLDVLTNAQENEKITVEIVDFSGDTYTVRNDNTLELFAGNYADAVNILNKETFGTIIRKTAYIRIKNGNNIPVEMRTLVPGSASLDSVNAPKYYNVPVRNNKNLLQQSKQILFFRNVDVTNVEGKSTQYDVFQLIVEPSPDAGTSTIVPANEQQANVPDVDRDVIYWDGEVHACKLDTDSYSGSYNCFSREIEKFIGTGGIEEEFGRLARYDSIIKDIQKQYAADMTVTDSDDIRLTARCGFADNDVYAIGKNTCGAFFYPIISEQQQISVAGDTSVSTLVIQPNSEILIPIVFEYRMTDRLGYVNGDKLATPNTTLVYGKKIGVDMMINNSVFRFDVAVTAKLKSKATPIDGKNVNSVIAAFKDENKQSIL